MNELKIDSVGHVTYALGRAIEQLDKVEDFGTEAAGRLLDTLHSLYYLRCRLAGTFDIREDTLLTPSQEEQDGQDAATTAPDNVAPFTTTEEETPFDTPELEAATTYSKSDVRAALGTARTKGLDVPKFLREFVGVESFSKVPQGKYNDIMRELAERGF